MADVAKAVSLGFLFAGRAFDILHAFRPLCMAYAALAPML
jgi:hypothetical protein